MAEVVYILCALTCFACAALLIRGYQSSHSPLLFWSALCFSLLLLNNVLLVVDLMVVPEYDLRLVRGVLGLSAMGVLVIGLTRISVKGGRP